MKKDDLVFVYGTLRKGQSADILERGGVTFIGDDRISGEMYNLGWYPGVVDVLPVSECGFISEGPTVKGEVYRIDNDNLPRILDGYEGHPDLFERIQVSAESGLTVWVYRYNHSVSDRELIPGGDWVNRGLGMNEVLDKMRINTE